MTNFTEWDFATMTLEEHRRSYGMFTREGSAAVEALLTKVKGLPMTATDEEVYAALNVGMKEISKAGHGEVYDTEVRECIIGDLERVTKRELSIFAI